MRFKTIKITKAQRAAAAASVAAQVRAYDEKRETDRVAIDTAMKRGLVTMEEYYFEMAHLGYAPQDVAEAYAEAMVQFNANQIEYAEIERLGAEVEQWIERNSK